jgi:ribosomal protein S1
MPNKLIGRLHMVSCQNTKEFESFTVSDRVECKILSIDTDGKRTFIELTRNKEHMAKLQGLDESLLSKMPKS